MVGRLSCKTVSVVQYTIMRKSIYKTLDVSSISLRCIAQLLMTTLRKKSFYIIVFCYLFMQICIYWVLIIDRALCKTMVNYIVEVSVHVGLRLYSEIKK